MNKLCKLNQIVKIYTYWFLSQKITRPKKTRINKDHSKVTNIDPRTRGLVECTCLLHCNGSKFVDPRTFEKYQKKIKQLELFQTITSESQGRERVIGY